LKRKGSALVEFVLCVPVLLVIWLALFRIGAVYAVKQRLCLGARYAAWTDGGISADPAAQARLSSACASQFIDPAKLAAAGKLQSLKLYFLSNENTVELSYPVELPVTGVFAVYECFTLAGNSWRFGDISGRKSYYEDKLRRGDTDFRNWRGAGDEEKYDLCGYN